MDKQLFKLINIAKQNVYFYKDKFKDYNIDENTRLCDLPLTFKNEILLNESYLINNKYIVNKNKYDIVTERTSGSTGKCLELYWEKGDFIASNLELFMKRKKWYDIKTNDKVCYFYSRRENHVNSDNEEPEIIGNGMGFSKLNLNKNRCERILDNIYLYQPKWLLLQPSIAFILAKVIFELGIVPPESLKYIELTGEMLNDNTKRFISAAFEADVKNQYGTYEVGSIAYECPCGNLHVMEGNVVVEIVDHEGNVLNDGEEGLIAITSRNNKTMPFIRYIVGDYGILHDSECKCGCNSKILKLTKGRENDSIITKNNTPVSVYEFISVIDSINNESTIFIYQYNIIQEDIDRFKIRIAMKGDSVLFEKMFYNKLMSEDLRTSKYRFEYLDYIIPDERTGKLKTFISKVN